MDLREEIERELGNEPVDRFAIDDALRAGRRGVVRRRALSALVATAASVVVATGLVVVLDPGAAPTGERVASQGADRCDGPSAGRTSEECEGYQYVADHPVAYTPGGQLVIRDGWTWTFKVTQPLDGVGGAAGVVTDGTDTDWTLMREPDADRDTFSQHDDPADLPADLTFDSWLDVAVARWQGTPATTLVSYDASGELVAQPGWQILQQRFDITFPASYRGPEGVDAVVEMAQPARAWFLVRPTADGGAEAFPLLFGRASADAVIAHVSSPAYDPSRQGMLGEAP